MYLLAPFILQNFKKIIMAEPELRGCAIFGTKMTHLSWRKIFWYKPFFKKDLTADPELWECTIFGPKMVHLPQSFFWKIIKIILIYLLAPFIVQNFKKILPADTEFWGCAIFGPKMAHFPKWEFFFRKTVNELCFFHSCLSTRQKSKSDINLLVKYWQLKKMLMSPHWLRAIFG